MRSDFLEDHTTPLPVERSERRISTCNRCDQKFPGDAPLCPECRIQQEERVLLFGPTAAGKTPSPIGGPVCACGCGGPVAEGRKLAGRSCTGRYTAKLRAEDKLSSAWPKRVITEPQPKTTKGILEHITRNAGESSRDLWGASDDYATAAHLARTYSTEQLRAALSLRELLG